MNDFDFFVGSLERANTRLKKALAGLQPVGRIADPAAGVSLLGPAGHLDELSEPTRGYSREGEALPLNWISSRYPFIDTPVVGRLSEDIGSFFTDDTYERQRIRRDTPEAPSTRIGSVYPHSSPSAR